jgi:predicted lipoprotein with Yx(FWY)xxD motif
MVLIATALAIAGCGSDNNEQGASAQGASGGVVAVQSVDGSNVLVDRQGRTLYSADVEKGGKIMCTRGCVTFWAPVLGTASDAKAAGVGDLGTVERPDGDSQLTFKGLPLYTFTDESAGQLTGDGFMDDFAGTAFTWHAARASGNSDPAGGSTGSYGY